MRYLQAAALAATGALLVLSTPALACEFNMRSDVTTEAPQPAAPERTADAAQPSAPTATATPAAERAIPAPASALAQTAEADVTPSPTARPN
ncbi:MAG: hypothetical protein AB7E81_05630 [Hyphomicrobiaceae bacterium]